MPQSTANSTKVYIRGKKWKILNWPSQSPGRNPSECWRGSWGKQQPKEAAVKAAFKTTLLLTHNFCSFDTKGALFYTVHIQFLIQMFSLYSKQMNHNQSRAIPLLFNGTEYSAVARF